MASAGCSSAHHSQFQSCQGTSLQCVRAQLGTHASSLFCEPGLGVSCSQASLLASIDNPPHESLTRQLARAGSAWALHLGTQQCSGEHLDI